MKILPLNKRILVKPEPEGETTKSGLVIARSKGERTESVAIKGTVTHIAKELKNPSVKVGDIVMVAKWEVQQAQVGAEVFLVVKEEDILVKLEE